MESDVIKIRKNTQPTISGHHVGVANIWERDVPDDQGVVAPRMAATMAITNPATGEERDLQVFAGSVVSLGADRYCVAEVEEGSAGFVTLRKLAP